MTPRPPAAVLVDADGVLQRNPPGWLDDVRSFVPTVHAEAFTDDLWDAERAALRGECTFGDVVDGLAGRWSLRGREEELLAQWRRAEVVPSTVAVVRELRAAGIACHLATNQNDLRASYLRDGLGYGELFDRCFCSCEIGATKDEPAFFTHVLAELGLDADLLLLVDDQPRYADTARALGLRAVVWRLDEGPEELRLRLAAQGVALPG